MYSEQTRVLHYAVLASILLHGALLSSLPQRERVRVEEAAPLVARLVEPPAPPAAAPSPPEPVAPPPRKKAAVSKPRTQAKPAPAPAEPKVEELVVEKSEPAPALPAPSVAAPTPDAPQASAPPVLAPSEAKSLDPTTLAQYRLQVLSAASKFKAYPRVAQENDWEGVVRLRMVIASSGTVASLTVQESSGYRILDQQALEMFRKASAVVPVPAALRGKEFAVEQLAVNFFKTD